MINFIDMWARKNELVPSAFRQKNYHVFPKETWEINFTKQARLIRVWSLKLNIAFDTLVFELRPNFDYPIDQLIKTSHVKPGVMCCAGHQKILSKPRGIKVYCTLNPHSRLVLWRCHLSRQQECHISAELVLRMTVNVMDSFWVVGD